MIRKKKFKEHMYENEQNEENLWRAVIFSINYQARVHGQRKLYQY
jgi:hypothetical protein